MQRSSKDYLFIFFKGIAMGAADVVPGVSGGTIAFISGIYKELIESISNLNLNLIRTLKNEGIKSFWKKANANFLLALFSGIFVSVFSVMKLMHYFLENHPIPLWAFFWGVVFASVLFVSKQIGKWTTLNIVLFISSSLIAFLLTKLDTFNGSASLFFLIFSGAIASCAMILPGISGAFILILLGVYGTISEAVHELEFKKIAAVIIGAIIGLLSFSKFLKWLFKTYENATLAVLGGFILGSLNKIWPWKKVLSTKLIGDKLVILKENSIFPFNYEGNPQIILAIIFAIIGFLLIMGLEKIAQKTN